MRFAALADGAGETLASSGAAPALPARNRHPGGVGAPPGGTMASRQELADVDAGPSACGRSPWNGQIP